MTELHPTPVEELAALTRPHLALALDTGDLESAVALWRRCLPFFGIAKVGLELYAATGPAAVARLREEGAAVFVDLKLHDIPNTVERAARQIGALGASYLTVHLAGGEAMVAGAVAGFEAGSGSGSDSGSGPLGPRAGLPRPGILGVTVLTSDPTASAAVLAERAALGERIGCSGLVCATPDLPVVRPASSLPTVVPGIRRSGSSSDDQSRVATPAVAIAAGASVLVIGRTLTTAGESAPEELAREVAAALL